MQPAQKPAYSFRDDPSIVGFDDGRILLVMDGQCALCSAAARRIAALDHKDQIRITTAGGSLGQAVLRHYGLDPDDPQSWLLVQDGRAYGSLDAIIRLAGQLHPILRALAVFRVLPQSVQDWLYARLARNRYAMFGQGDLCALPSDALKRRLV